MRALVHAQQKNHDGRNRVYRVAFKTLTDARRYVRGTRRPVKAVIESQAGWECYSDGALVSKESA